METGKFVVKSRFIVYNITLAISEQKGLIDMTVKEYFEALKGKRVCVIGLGISNRPLVKMLLERGIPVECRDRTP